MNNFQTIIPWILPICLIAGGLLAGLLVEKFVLAKLRQLTAQTKWGGAEITVNALSGMPLIWGGLLGIRTALISLPINPSWTNVLHKALLVIAIFSVTVVAGRVAVGLVAYYAGRIEGVLPATSIFTNLTRLFVFLLGGLIILQSLDISITPILTALGVGGLAVALALQPTLSNLFSGLQIIASGQVKPGDYVKLESGEEGYINDITWRNTSIRARPNNMIIVPNAKLASAIVTNHDQPDKETAVGVEVGVSYDCDLQRVEQITIEVAQEVLAEVPGGVPDFEPVIRYHTFGDSSINFKVGLRAREFADQFLLKHEFVKRLHARYRQEGIDIPYPIRTLYVKREEEPTDERLATTLQAATTAHRQPQANEEKTNTATRSARQV
jgi:small-conductance mechanosensitive channel